MGMTMEKLAELTGTSMATVSRVLANKPGVAPKTRNKILRLAEELGYQPNRNAQNLARSRTQLLGYVAAELSNPGHIDFLRSVQSICKPRGYEVLVMDSARDIAREKENLDIMLQHRVDGLLVFPVSDWVATRDIDHLLRLKLKRFPFVVVGRVEGYPFDSASSEEVESARRLTNHLIGLGHERFAFVGYSAANRCARERMEGVQMALREAGLVHSGADASVQSGSRASVHNRADASVDTASGASVYKGYDGPPEFRFIDTDHDSWKQEVVSWLREPYPPTALIAGDLARALELYRPLTAAGYRIPEHASVAGFDDEYWTVEIQPSLTVCAVDEVEVARAALEILFTRMDSPEHPVMTHLVPQKLITRESTGPAPAAVAATRTRPRKT